MPSSTPASIPPTVAGSQTGVFVGLTHGDYELLAAGSDAVEGPYGFSGTSNSFASGRVSYALGLHGPAVTMDTACSSGLMAVHQACRSLDDGESDLALAGGVAVALEPRKSIAGSLQGMLSPIGSLPRVRRRRRRVRVRRGRAWCCCSSGCPTRSATATGSWPSSAAPRPTRTAAPSTSRRRRSPPRSRCTGPRWPRRASIPPPSAWSRRTAPAPRSAIRSNTPAWPRFTAPTAPAVLGSVKTNFGHLQSTSGPLGLMKAILALQHGVVPQNLHFNRLPEELAAIETDLFVPQDSTPWPTQRGPPAPRRGVVVRHVRHERARDPRAGPRAAPRWSGRRRRRARRRGCFPLSATSAEQLRVTAGRLADWVDEQGDGDLAGSRSGATPWRVGVRTGRCARR